MSWRPFTKQVASRSGVLGLCLVLSACSTVNPKNFGEGVRVMTGKGGTVEERDTIKEVVPDARDLATYQPKPQWQTVLHADATDLIEFVSPDKVLVGFVQFSSALAVPEFGGVELYDSGTGQRLWEGKRKDIGNGLFSVLAQSLLSLSSGIESVMKSVAVNALIERKQLELNHAVMLQARALQGKYWVRPFSKRGTSVAIVDLDTGKRVDVQFSAPSIGMSLYGTRLPCIRIAPDGASFVTAEIGLDESKYEKYVKFKLGMPYPSLMSYGLAKLQFREAIWDDSALCLAAESGNLQKVRTLLASGAWVDSRNILGSTSLVAAATKGHDEIVRLLIGSGAKLGAGKDAGRSSAIEMAAYGGHASTVKLLLGAH